MNSLTRTVVLPGGDEVQIGVTPEAWWGNNNQHGYVAPDCIAPDPKNPRRQTNPARLAELRQSVAAHGVRQTMVVTPLTAAPWAKVDPEHAHRFFLAVSGHRRREAAIVGDVMAVPVQVKVYPDEKHHRMDMSLLNKGQDDLSALDEGYEIVELQRLGWKVEELSKSFGIAVPGIYNRMNLTKLHPDLQALLDDSLSRDMRLSQTTAGALGGVKTPTIEDLDDLLDTFGTYVQRSELNIPDELELLSEDDRRFALQKLFMSVIKKRRLSSTQAIEFIRDRTFKLQSMRAANGRPSERHQPQRRKSVIDAMISGVTGSMAVDWPAQEIRRIFDNSSREEVEKYIEEIENAANLLAGIVSVLERVKDSKRPTRPEVSALLARPKGVVAIGG